MIDVHAFADLWWVFLLPMVAFGSPDPPKPPPPPPPPTDDNAAAQEAQAQERAKQQAKQGRESTKYAGKKRGASVLAQGELAETTGATGQPLGGQQRTGVGYAGVTGQRVAGPGSTVPPGAYM